MTGQPVSAAAWQQVPTTYLVCAQDRGTPAERQREYARRAGRVVELDAGHHPFLSQPAAVRDLLLGWFEAYAALISLHKGGPAKITSAMGDPDSPIVSKCQVLTRATQRVVDRLSEDQALRPGMDAVTMCRLVGGVAAVADQGDLDADAVRPLLAVVADGMIVA